MAFALPKIHFVQSFVMNVGAEDRVHPSPSPVTHLLDATDHVRDAQLLRPTSSVSLFPQPLRNAIGGAGCSVHSVVWLYNGGHHGFITIFLLPHTPPFTLTLAPLRYDYFYRPTKASVRKSARCSHAQAMECCSFISGRA